jgi:allantoate deiminase
MSPSAERVARDVQTLTGERYSSTREGVTRHAYTPEYANTLEYFESRFAELGFEVWYDPVGTFVASNRPPGAECFGIGSHCDSVRRGGAYDGTLGVVCALEVCRLAHDRGLDLPLRVISFLEEEGSGFGQLLLGSRIVAGAVTDEELRGYANRDGVPFMDAARQAGYEPERHAESAAVLDGMVGWVEVHIEQGRVLESNGERLGLVDAIAGYIQADIEILARRDHAGATPMDLRSDAAVTAAEVVVALEGLARDGSPDTVATVGELTLDPGVVNVIPGRARFSIDTRSVTGDHERVAKAVVELARERAGERGQEASYAERQSVPPTPLDERVVAALTRAAEESGAPFRRMHSAAAHDTMMVARRTPAAMVFVPCEDGVSHSPEERADPGDGALAAEVTLSAIEELMAA